MAFIRLKKIKKGSGNIYMYGYLVENSWRKRPKSGKRGSRQKVKKYLGRVYEFEERGETIFYEYVKTPDYQEYLKNRSFREIVQDLVNWEIYRHHIEGFKATADSVRKEGSSCVIKINEGFMCSHTLQKLLGFTATGEEREDGIELAQCFIEAGIDIPEELFVGIFGKITRHLDEE